MYIFSYLYKDIFYADFVEILYTMTIVNGFVSDGLSWSLLWSSHYCYCCY